MVQVVEWVPAGPTIFAPTMTVDEARRLAMVLKAVADSARLRILHLLSRHGGVMCVRELVETISDLEQPTVSHHLRILLQVGLITYRKQGLHVYYLIDPQAVGRLAPVSSLLADIFSAPSADGEGA